jgi:hypothetical protein
MAVMRRRSSLDLELRRRITAMLDDLAQGRRTVRECLAELESRA